jgi:hypothetical protein
LPSPLRGLVFTYTKSSMQRRRSPSPELRRTPSPESKGWLKPEPSR